MGETGFAEVLGTGIAFDVVGLVLTVLMIPVMARLTGLV
jgi:hypothetical protein